MASSKTVGFAPNWGLLCAARRQNSGVGELISLFAEQPALAVD